MIIRQGSPLGASETFSDPAGHYRFDNLPPGSYRITVQRDGFLPFTYGAKAPDRPGKLFVLAQGENHDDLNFSLSPPGSISGRVLDQDGDPVDGISIQALRKDPNRDQIVTAATATTNDLGEYRLFGLPPGQFYLATLQRSSNLRGASDVNDIYPSAFYPGTPDFPSAAILNIAAGGDAREIDIRVTKSSAASLRGAIIDLPAVSRSFLQLRLFRRDREALSPAFLASNFPGGLKNNGGEFEFNNLPLGSYVLFGQYQTGGTWFFARQDIEMSGNNLTDVRLEFTKAMTLPATVQVTGDAKADVTRLSLTRTDPYGIPSITSPVPAAFTLNSINPGKWHASILVQPPDAYVQSIQLGQQDGLSGNLEIRPDTAGPLTIVLGSMGGMLEGTVHSPGDTPRPLENAAVLLVPASGIIAHLKTATCGPDGHFQLRGIAPGKYRIFALEDLPPLRDPDFLRTLDPHARELLIAPGPNPAQDLTPTAAP